MKRLLIGLLVLGSLSAFAYDTCGLKGTINERIQDCGYQENEGFLLVSRTAKGIEVHMEIKAELLWSDRLADRKTHYEAQKSCKSSLKEVAGITASWRLPSIEEWRHANVPVIEPRGVRAALPRMVDEGLYKDSEYWTSSIDPTNPYLAKIFGGKYGDEGYSYREYQKWVRCVARL